MAMLFGTQHQALIRWMAEEWWEKDPPVAVIQGFPGTGKTEIAIRAIEELKRSRMSVRTALVGCPETKTGLADDLLLAVAEELAANRDKELIERVEQGEDSAAIFGRVLLGPRVVVIDDAQNLAVGATGILPSPIASLLERWSHTPCAAGRLLLLSSREFEQARWIQRVKVTTLKPLDPGEATAFLLSELDRAERREAVPSSRVRDVATWLGSNPRAIKLLVTALSRENLDELIGLAPEAWEARDRMVSPELLRGFEEVVLQRAELGLDHESLMFLRRLSVLRHSVDRRGLQALAPEGTDMPRLRDELMARFMLELRGHRYEMHPVLRDTVRLRMTETERRRTHLMAGRYHAAPFRARQMVGDAEQLGGRFLEARYHFTLAESEQDLADISARFEAHFRTIFHATSPVPSNPQEHDERIALLSALLQARGPKGLEYYLARCLIARGRIGDAERALPHARRATGPQSSAQAWVLRIRLEGQVLGVGAALKAAREGIDIVPPAQNLFSLYEAAAEILARDGQPDEAIGLLRQGVGKIPATHSLFVLYQAAGAILNRYGRLSEALEWLIEGRTRVLDSQNGYRLAEAAILIAYAGNCLDKLPSATFGSQQKSLFAILRTLNDDPRRAAEIGATAISLGVHYLTLYAITAFAWLCAGEPTLAKETLNRFPGGIRREPRSAAEWLIALIALELGDLSTARTHLEVYLDHPLTADKTINREYLLQFWDVLPDAWQSNPAYYFSKLPPRLTGLATWATRSQHGGPVLPSAVLQHELAPDTPSALSVQGPPQMGSVIASNTQKILTAMRPDKWSGLYVLGCYDLVKTVYRQQCRALTLIHALFETGELRPGMQLGVIGGGAAGVTAAAAAARKGARVILFERSAHLLPLQRQSTKRWLHPHLYDWPARGSLEKRAGLPLLDWKADTASRVAEQIVSGFESVKQQSSTIDIRLGQTIQDVGQLASSDQAKRIQIIGAEGDINEHVDVAIVAIGFGIEHRRRLGVETPAYWEDDALNQALGTSPSRPQRILVSGAGDGALIDILRSTLRDFRHEEIVGLLPESEDMRRLESELLRIEVEAKRAAEISGPGLVDLHKMYSHLDSVGVQGQLGGRIRDDTEVFFNFKSVGRYSIQSSILNRFLVSTLCVMKKINIKYAFLEDKDIKTVASGGYTVKFPNDQHPIIFDRIVIRHGPPADFLGAIFPRLSEACAPLKGKLADLDLTGSLSEETRQFFAA